MQILDYVIDETTGEITSVPATQRNDKDAMFLHYATVVKQLIVKLKKIERTATEPDTYPD